MTRPVSTGGNGDVCPSNPEHARMYLMEKSRRQFCAHSDHSRVSDPAIFEYDGVTPVLPTPAPVSPDRGRGASRASRPAPEIPASALAVTPGLRPRDADPRGEPDRARITTPEQPMLGWDAAEQ